jgi:CRISPR system Cascade subunit CasA
MDLLQSSWIQVIEDATVIQISFEQLLCSPNHYQLSLPRDDMELAALQLVISLAQCILTPKDRKELVQRWQHPLATETYRQAVEPYRGWFVLDHPQHPFMQTRGVKAKEATPIQKLFIGLPEGNNHALFNDKGEIAAVCGSCAAIALFNQASNCPSFGGSFKASIRGSAPITTFAAGDHLRETLWFNVLSLSHDCVADLIIPLHVNNLPVWVDPIPARGKIYAHEIGLLRGLFWQPARVELIATAAPPRCDACGQVAELVYSGFHKEKFVYDIAGLWPHPHSPKRWDIKKDAKERERFLSFTTQAPAWTQLNHYTLEELRDTKEGSEPSPIVTQFHQVFSLQRRRLILLVAGYRNNRASVMERRHELFSMPQDWSDQIYIRHGITYALQVKQELRSKLYGFAKQVGPDVHDTAERQFYHATEPLIHGLLHDMDYREGEVLLADFKNQVTRLARDLFESLTTPYCHTPKGLKYFSVFKRSLEAALAQLNV